MRQIKSLLLLSLLVAGSLLGSDFSAIPDKCLQLLVVDAPDWNTYEGSLRLYERSESGAIWKTVGDLISVDVGENGMAWGLGLHTIPSNAEFIKKEGDGRAPAGIFALGRAFGLAAPEDMTRLKMPYLMLTPSIEAVDDPNSQYYNQIVDRATISNPDWNSSEKMSSIVPCYILGVEILHNFPNPVSGAGSAIFFHIWRESTHAGTAGCTSMSREHIETLINWLDASKFPLLLQMPRA